jgi:hypothetical protein
MTIEELKKMFCGKIVQQVSHETPNPNPIFLIEDDHLWSEGDTDISYYIGPIYRFLPEMSGSTASIYNKNTNTIEIEEYIPCPGQPLKLTLPVTLESFKRDLVGVVIRPHSSALPIEITEDSHAVELDGYFGFTDAYALYKPWKNEMYFDVVDSCPLEAMSAKNSLLEALKENTRDRWSEPFYGSETCNVEVGGLYDDNYKSVTWEMVGVASGKKYREKLIILRKYYNGNQSMTCGIEPDLKYITIAEWTELDEKLLPRYTKR